MTILHATSIRVPGVVSALLACLVCGGAASAQSLSILAEREAELGVLMQDLATPDLPTWESTEGKIIAIWSRSGSDTADLLLQRGQEAIEAEDYRTAVEHLTALTDHAPAFAEGWHARATAFYSMEEFGLALADLRQALALNPQHFGAMTGMGIVLTELGQPELALKILREARALNPNRENIQDHIKRIRRLIGDITL